MDLKDHPWPCVIPPVTPDFPHHASEWTSHPDILAHLQAAACRFGLEDRVHYRALAERLCKQAAKWALTITTLVPATGDDLEICRVRKRQWGKIAF